eukprot:jgi/Chlat1/5799/Chrsp4S06274
MAAATTMQAVVSQVAATRPAVAKARRSSPAAAVAPRSAAAKPCSQASLGSSSFVGAQLPAVSRRAAASSSSSSRQVTRAELGDSLEEFLLKATPDQKLRQVLLSLGEALRTIAYKVRTASCGATACFNSFGDEQLAVDALRFSGVCASACSEEVPEVRDMGGEGFSVAFDPLDGSSIVDTNFAVGTIFGVWPGSQLTGIKGSDLAASGMGVYGPRTTYMLAVKGHPGTHEFLLQDDGKWMHVHETYEIKEGKLFSPGNLRATFDNPAYEKLISYWIGEKYTLRYTGGMVPDVNQILIKEKGIFCNATSPSTKAKLRVLFEVAPLGLLIENAGGFSSDGTKSVLDILIDHTEVRTQVAYGSKKEVIRFEEYLTGKSRLAEPVKATA